MFERISRLLGGRSRRGRVVALATTSLLAVSLLPASSASAGTAPAGTPSARVSSPAEAPHSLAGEPEPEGVAEEPRRPEGLDGESEPLGADSTPGPASALANGEPAAPIASCGPVERVSVSSDGTQVNRDRLDAPSISADARVVAWESAATNLVPDITNDAEDVFVRDRDTGVTERVSVTPDGSEANGRSFASRHRGISADGRFVTFFSTSSDLVSNDTNGYEDVFVHDRDTGVTERVSVASDGTEANFFSTGPTISADGRFVAFRSGASNLVPGVTGSQIYVHDRQTGVTELMSVASDGTPGKGGFTRTPSISADGRFVAFTTTHTNLVPDDTNRWSDVFVHDRQTGATERVSIASDGTEANHLSQMHAAISADGRHVAFMSRASNLTPGDTNDTADTFVHDRQTGVTERVSIASDSTAANNQSGMTTGISADGRYVLFSSWASNLVPGDTNRFFDIFVRDRAAGVTMRVSVADDCTEADGTIGGEWGGRGDISPDGRVVAFLDDAANLVPGDTNGATDAFMHTLPELFITPVSTDFGPVSIGQTRGGLSVTLTNITTDDVTVSEVSGLAGPFGVDGGTCGAMPFTLTAAESCELHFSFSPTATGVFSDEVTLISDDPDGPYTVDLTGIGSDEELHLAPEPLNFGGVLPGETGGPRAVTVTNADTVAMEVATVSTPGAPFDAAGGTCGKAPFSLDPFASCTLDYTFSPTEVGSVSGVVEVASDASGSPHRIALRGRGLLSELAVSPGLLDFGEVSVGEAGDLQTVTLTNTGEVEVRLDSVSGPGGPFRLVGFTCQTVLAPGASCTQDYAFSPTALGDVSAEVAIAHDAPSSPDTVALRGVGGGVGGGALVFESPSLDFGEVEGGSTTRPQTATLRNTGKVALTGLTFTVSGDGYEADTSGCGTRLAPGGSCPVRVTFTPPKPGPADTMLAVFSTQDVSAGLGLTGQGLGDPWAEEAKFTASDGATFDFLGDAAAVDGDTALIAAYGANRFQGAVYVFVRRDGVWTEQAKLTASDGAAGDAFGLSVALEGDTAVVGASFAEVDGNPRQGAAYVFTRSDGVWTEQAKLTASDGESYDQFGWSVAVEGDTALVGAINAEWEQAQRGAAYVFTRSDGVWTEQTKLTASDGENHDGFGCSVALQGDTALVGAPVACIGLQGNDTPGQAYVFTRSDGVWTEQAKLTASDEGELKRFEVNVFGTSVALEGDTALVGATEGNSRPGAVYVFTRSGEGWTEQAKLTGPDGQARNGFGISVALEGDTALVGALGDVPDPEAGRTGAAYVFTRSGGPWSRQEAPLTASDGAGNDQLGTSVALSGDTVLAGARLADPDGNSAQGAAYAFVPNTTLPGDGITLGASGRTERGERTVMVSWQGADSDEVDVFRDGERIATVPNPGFYADEVGGRGEARYVYQVCEAGTSRCSNEATVTFSGPAGAGGRESP